MMRSTKIVLSILLCISLYSISSVPFETTSHALNALQQQARTSGTYIEKSREEFIVSYGTITKIIKYKTRWVDNGLDTTYILTHYETHFQANQLIWEQEVNNLTNHIVYSESSYRQLHDNPYHNSEYPLTQPLVTQQLQGSLQAKYQQYGTIRQAIQAALNPHAD